MALKNPTHKVTINKATVIELALHGPQERIESLFRETHPAMKRLGLEPAKRPFRKRPRAAAGGRPNIHDIMRWLENLEATDEFADDLAFLQQLHTTIRGRAHMDVIAEVEKKDD